MTTTPFRLLALCLSTVAAASRPRDDAATATCLADPSATCDLTTPCAAGSFTRACLDSWVPFRTAHDRVTCCLDCCLSSLSKSTAWTRTRHGLLVVPELASQKAKARCWSPTTTRARCPYASRRLTKRQNAWLGKHTKALGPELSVKVPRARVCGRRPPRHSIEALERAAHGHARLPRKWQGAGARPRRRLRAGLGRDALRGRPGAHSPQSPFGAYREVTLAAFWRAARLGTMDKARLALVTSTDCDTTKSRRFQETPPRFC